MAKDERKERRCKFCRKLLIDEKALICRRCKLEGEKIAAETVGAVVLGTAAITAALKTLSNEVDKND